MFGSALLQPARSVCVSPSAFLIICTIDCRHLRQHLHQNVNILISAGHVSPRSAYITAGTEQAAVAATLGPPRRGAILLTAVEAMLRRQQRSRIVIVIAETRRIAVASLRK